MTVVTPCQYCQGYGGVPSAYGTETCPRCEGRGYHTSSDSAPPVIERKPDKGMPPQVQLPLPL